MATVRAANHLANFPIILS